MVKSLDVPSQAVLPVEAFLGELTVELWTSEFPAARVLGLSVS